MNFYHSNDPRSQTWSVTELNQYIRELFELDFRLQDVEVQGEISNFTRARSGHLYFTLKDEGAQVKCVMWRTAAAHLGTSPQDGDAVVVNGRLSVYEAGGVYQLYAERIFAAGRGDLALAFEELKNRLAAEGLFAEEHKRQIPPMPRKIGIVTSADAAALRDILQVLQRRWPIVEVLIAPTLVQGPAAPPQIIRALQWLDGREDIDSIILARGGGSMEDLWAFNDEGVARAIFAAQHAVISGVGHEVDFTIADFVADLRAPTPSAAAEMTVPDMAEMRPLITGAQQHLAGQMSRFLQQRRWAVDGLLKSLRLLNPRAQVDSRRQQLDGLYGRLERQVEQLLRDAANRLTLAESGLQTVSPLATLARGYAIVKDSQGDIIRSATIVKAGQTLAVQVSDGEFAVTVAAGKS